jgi:tetratricopeptide (TPR) repeat protein
LETCCCLAICHANAGQQALAEETCRIHVQPLVATMIDQHVDPERPLGVVEVLKRNASALWEARLNSAGLPIARKAAELTSNYAAFPTRDLGFTAALAGNASHLATALKHLGDPSASLEQANLARRLYEQAGRADPDNVQRRVALVSIWSLIGKVHWDLGRADESLAALGESARIQRQLFEADSSNAFHRYNLDRCYGRLAYWSTLKRDWAGTAAALLEQEKLWPDDSDKLMGVSRDFKELAEDMARGRESLSAEEEPARQHYLAESDRTRQAAEAAARRQKHSLKADR